MMIRTCPKCSAYYADQSLAFCLADGTPLVDVDNERWSEATKAIEEKTRTARKQHRKLIWRRIVMATLTTSMLAIVVSRSYVVETTTATTIPPLTLTLPSPSKSIVYKISGRVTNAGEPVAGISVRLEGSTITSTTTDRTGYYAFRDLQAGGSYTITPVIDLMIFTPPNRSFNNLTHDESADFTGIRERDPRVTSQLQMSLQLKAL